MNCNLFLGIVCLLVVFFFYVQDDKFIFMDWFYLDLQEDGYFGMSIYKVYCELFEGKVSQIVIVVIIDSGVDVEYEDLVDVMWVNEDEIFGNGIDDDKNGYIDDIYGWNFIGGFNGESVNSENLEIICLYC